MSFCAIGDWGTTGLNQSLIAHHIGEHAADYRDSFLALLGDNYYPIGVSSITDPQWDLTYRSVFTHPALTSLPFYAILGNHDYMQEGGPEAELQYARSKIDGGRWQMPDHIYLQRFDLPRVRGSPAGSAAETLEVLFIDTTQLAVTETGETALGGIHYVAPEVTLASLVRIEALLRASNATWLVVAGHYTIFSNAEHGDTPDLISYLVPLLEKYDVNMYMNGHDHVLQHISWKGVEYFTTGHGTLTNDYPRGWWAADSVAKRGSRFGVIGPGYLAASADADTMTVDFHNTRGESIYSFLLTNPRVPKDRGYALYNRTSGAHLPSLAEKDFPVVLVLLLVMSLVGAFALSIYCCGCSHFGGFGFKSSRPRSATPSSGKGAFVELSVQSERGDGAFTIEDEDQAGAEGTEGDDDEEEGVVHFTQTHGRGHVSVSVGGEDETCNPLSLAAGSK